MNANPHSAITVSALLAFAGGTSLALAQPAVEVQYLGVIGVRHQTTPPTLVVPSSPGQTPNGFDVLPWGRMTVTLGSSAPRTTYMIDGSTLTQLFPAGQQAAGLPTGTTYSGGIRNLDSSNRADPFGNYVFQVNITGSSNAVPYWGPLNNLQPLASAFRLGPTPSGWWMKQDASSNLLVDTNPNPATVRIAAGQRPDGLSASATNIQLSGVTPRLFDGGEITVLINATLPGVGTKQFWCIADASGYRVIHQQYAFIADLGYYQAGSAGFDTSYSVGGDGTILCQGGLATSSAGANRKDAIWTIDPQGHATLLVMEGQQAPALPPGVLVAHSFNLPATGAIIGRNGDIVSWFELTGPGVTPLNDSALVLFDREGSHLLLRSGDTMRFGNVDATVPPFCGGSAAGSLYTGVWLNQRGDIALWSGTTLNANDLLATYHRRTGWAGLAKSNTPPIAGFSTPETINQALAFKVVSGPMSSSGYDIGMQRLDDDGWVYFVQSLVSGGSFATKARIILPPCPADFDADGSVDFFDYDQFVQCFEGLACPPGQTADFDHDGSVDFFDYDAFVIAFETPC